MWKIIQASYPIWHIDATGSVIEKIKNQKIPYYYSIVCHDLVNKQILPIACFVTTSHTINSITTNLSIIKDHVENNVSRTSHLPIAPIIVMDHSWALIGSVIKSFNKTTVLTYLIWCFDIYFNEENFKANYFATRVYICSIHMLKIIIKKAKKVANATKKGRNALIFSFTLLQNSVKLAEFNYHLENIYILFNSKYETLSMISSLNFLKDALALREISLSFDYEEKKEIDLRGNINGKVFLENTSFNENLKQESPFQHYYDDLIKTFESSLENNPVETNLEFNQYYNPDLFKIIRSKLYIMIFWSGLVLDNFKYSNSKVLTKLDDNTAEKWFEILKNRITQGQKVMPSELIGKLYNRLLAKYFEFYHKITPIFQLQMPKKQEKQNKAAEEIWVDKNEKSNKNKKKGKKGFYYRDSSIFGSRNSNQGLINTNRIKKTFDIGKNYNVLNFIFYILQTVYLFIS